MKLSFVVCVSDKTVLTANLLASPCLGPDSTHQLIQVDNCPNAAWGFEQGMMMASGDILVFVHQDVFLPFGWDTEFISGFISAQKNLGAEVVGIYGLGMMTNDGHAPVLGEVVDRGRLLKGSVSLPARAHALDELLFAVPGTSRLRLDPELGFDLYATDMVLQAEKTGSCAAVVNARCEHNSVLPRKQIPLPVMQRFHDAVCVFEKKWAWRFPLQTPCAMFCQEHPVSDHLEKIIALQYQGKSR